MSKGPFAKAATGEVLRFLGAERLYGALYARLQTVGSNDSYLRPISKAVRDLGSKHPSFEEVQSLAEEYRRQMKEANACLS